MSDEYQQLVSLRMEFLYLCRVSFEVACYAAAEGISTAFTRNIAFNPTISPNRIAWKVGFI